MCKMLLPKKLPIRKQKNIKTDRELNSITKIRSQQVEKLKRQSKIQELQTNCSIELSESPNKSENASFEHLLYSKNVEPVTKSKFLESVYLAVSYSVKMRSLTQDQIRKHQFDLPTSLPQKKTLFLDLDETLIHSSMSSNMKFDHKLSLNIQGVNLEIGFNVRPYCEYFLSELSKYYEIYIYTASNECYAKAMMDYLNQWKPTITGYLAREFCIKTTSGFYIKDLRRIGNRKLGQMILIDNLAYSFGHLLENGIPILDFTTDRSDCELLSLCDYLIEASKQEDVRDYNQKHLKLRELANSRPYFG